MLKKATLIFALFMFIGAAAQNSTASPYSLGGLGDVTFRGNAINRMMGGMSVYSDSIHANLNNPAAIANLKLTTFSVGVNYKNTRLSSAETNEDVSSGSLDYIAVSIPTKRFSFNFGILPYSSVGYRLQSVIDTEQETILNRYEGSGGLNKTFFGLGFTLFKHLNLGATINYNFGSITTQSSLQDNAINFGTFLSNQSSLSGFDFVFGGHLKYPLTKKTFVNLMGTFSPAHSITSSNEQTYYTRSNTTDNVGAAQEVDLSERGLDEVELSIGSKYEAGISFEKEKKWMLGAQYTSINSGGFSNDFIQLNNVTYENGNRLSVGGFFIPNYSSITSYWKRIVYRVGFRNETTGIKVNNVSLEETGISFGASFPLGGFYSASNVSGFSSFNIGLELGERGVNTGGLVRERYWALRVGLSLNDLWFIKRIYN